jgi:transketolase
LYATLAIKGFFSIDELNTYGENGSRLLSHTSHNVPGVELSTGSLGHALPVSLGVALAGKRKKMQFFTYCLLSDGEIDEGSNWEAFLSAPQFKLDNLIVIIDYNKIQSLGRTSEVISLEPLRSKFLSFNWEVFEVDGHNHAELKKTLQMAKDENGMPKVILAHTIKGKGVSFMEDSLLWHYKSPSEEQYNIAIKELKNNL